MGRRLFVTALAMCLILADKSFAESTCRKGCIKSDVGILKFSSGYAYDYNFESVLSIGVNGVTGNDDSTMKVSGIAKLFAEGNCGYTLQLSGLKVSSNKETIEKKITNTIQKPIHFTMENDQVQPEICVDANENTNSLNIKRAIVSLIQSASEGEQEIDVFGQCSSYKSSSKVGESNIITSIRNLNKCRYREHLSNGILTGIVNNKAGIKSTMLLSADYSKETKITNGILETVHTVEEYKYGGVSSKPNSDIYAKVITTLKIRNKAGTKVDAPSTGSKSASIIFEKPEPNVSKNIGVLKKVLSDLIQSTSDYVHKDSAKGFIELIRLMRNSDVNTLLELANVPNQNKVLARKVYLDALLRAGTTESAKATMKQFDKMTDKEKYLAVLSLNLVQNVDKETLHIASDLISSNSPKELFLVVGSLVSKYCKHKPCNVKEIETISKKFNENLKQCKPNTKQEEERIIYVLKGISNSEEIGKNVATVLAECAGIGRSNRIRVAALQAFQPISCENIIQKKALHLFGDRNEDSELRIEAYLSLIECPTAELATSISEIVNTETVNQVGGFVVSNLIAIRDSTDPSRHNQKHFLGNIRVTKKFPKDFRRYSFNNELSYKFDPLGISASSDYKLIYSQHGFLPRSARLNVSSEIFGTNFNIFEANIRQENLENVLEYFIGPKGLLNKDLDEIIKVIETGDQEMSYARRRRSIADEANKISKKYKSYGSKSFDDLNLDLSLKLFGTEMFFLSLGDKIPGSLNDIIVQLSDLFDSSKKELSAFSQEYLVHSFFLDTELIYPTASGIPFEVSAQGFSASKLDVGVNLAIDAILEQDWQNANFSVKAIPSIDVSVNLKAGFDASVLSTGLELSSNLQSATGSEIRFGMINDGNGFNFDIELPRNKMELIDIDVHVEFYLSESDKVSKTFDLKSSKSNKEVKPICSNHLEFLGITVCFISNVASNGQDVAANEFLPKKPFSFSLYLTSERHINLKCYQSPNLQNGLQKWNIEYSTPNAKLSHLTSVSFELGTKDRIYGRLTLDNDGFHYAVESGIDNNNKELVLYGQYDQNGETKKSKIGFSKHGNEYTPFIQVNNVKGTSDQINGYRIDGKVIVEKQGENGSKYIFKDLRLLNEKEIIPIQINGFADIGGRSLRSEVLIRTEEDSYKIETGFKIENSKYSVKAFINDEKTPQNVIGGQVDIEMNNEKFQIDLIGKGMSWEISTKTDVTYVKAENTNLLTSSTFQNDLTIKHNNQQVVGLNVQGSTKGQNNFKVLVEVQRNKKIASVSIDFASKQKSQYDYLLKINGKVKKHFLDLLSKCEFNGNHFMIDNVLTTSWGTVATVKGELGQRYTLQDVFIDVHGTVQASNNDKPLELILKAIGSPEKTSSELKILRDSAEFTKVTIETQHPQDKISSAKALITVKNTLSSKIDLKVAKNGKGELSAIMETFKTEPKHKIELSAKFHNQAPKYDLETTITFDANHKIYIKTENTLDKAKLNSKNLVEYMGKQILFDLNGSSKGDWKINGELQGNSKLTLPNGQSFDATMKRKISTNNKTGVSQGTLDIQFNDISNDNKKRSLVFNGKLEKFNWKTKDYASNIDIVYTNADNKQLHVGTTLNHLPKDSINKNLGFSLKIDGNYINKPIEINLAIDDYNQQHAVGHLSFQHSEFITGQISAQYNLGDRDKPLTYKIQSHVDLPQSKWKSFELSSDGKVLKARTDEGSHFGEINISGKAGSEQFLKLKGSLSGSRQKRNLAIDIESSQLKGPFKLEYSLEREHNDENQSKPTELKNNHFVSISLADQYLKSDLKYQIDATKNVNLHFKTDSSFEAAKNVEINVNSATIDTDNAAIKAEVKLNDDHYAASIDTFRGSNKKGFDLLVTLPKAAPIKISNIYEVLGDKKAKITTVVENLMELDFKGQAEASYHAIENFYIVAQWESVKLKLKGFEFDVHSDKGSVQIHLKNSSGLLFGGSAKISSKTEKAQTTIEGQGQLQYQGKTQNTNFRLVRKQFELPSDKEIGFSYTFNGNIGPKNTVSTFKITNRDFNVKFSLCEEKKQCTNLQMQSILEIDEQNLSNSKHKVLVLIDLRELGYPYEFDFQSETVKRGFQFEYGLDSSIISNNNLKYHLVANLSPSGSKFQIRLPSREILLENAQKAPSSSFFGHYESSTKFYIDKQNKPNDIIKFIAECDVAGVEYSALKLNGAMKFEHPTIKPMIIQSELDGSRERQSIIGNLKFDVFKTSEQAVNLNFAVQNSRQDRGFNVTVNNQLHSTGLGLHYHMNGHLGLDLANHAYSTAIDFGSEGNNMNINFHLYGSKEKLEVMSHVMNEQLLYMKGEINRPNHSIKMDIKLPILGMKSLQVDGTYQLSNAKVILKTADSLSLTGEIKIGKETKLQLENKDGKLFEGHLALDTKNFLQSSYDLNESGLKKEIENLETNIKSEGAIARKKVSDRLEEIKITIEEHIQNSKSSIPEFDKFQANFEGHLNQIVKELEVDPSFKQIADAYKNLYEKLSKIIEKAFKIINESYHQLSATLKSVWEKLLEALKESVLPSLEELYKSASKIFEEVKIDITKLLSEALENIKGLLERYGPVLRNSAKTINDTFKPVCDALQDIIRVIDSTTDELLNDLEDYLEKIPSYDKILDDIKINIDKLKIVEKTLEVIDFVFDKLQILPTTPETSEFLEKLQKYLVAKVKNENINEGQYIKEISELLLKALRSLLSAVEINMPNVTGLVSSEGISSILESLSPVYGFISQLPSILSFRSSILNYIQNEEWQNILSKEIFQSWMFFKDFELKGQIIDGRHILSFDGKYLSFDSNCKYVLAQDSVDNNFTVIANVNNGKLKSIIVTDSDSNYIELSDSGALKINGVAAEFPYHEKGIHAWRLYYTIWAHSEYGVTVMCTSDLKICNINVNGFYTSKIRGLLGNGNAEPYDDYLQIDGKIAPSLDVFVNNYAVGKCSAITSHDSANKHSEICSEVFAYDSPLALGYYFVDSKPYREACDQAVFLANEKDKELAACTVALAYGSSLKLENIPTMLPSRCLKCVGPNGQRDIAQEFTVKVPSNKADIVFVIDFGVSDNVLQHFISPTVNGLRETLKARGFTDVNIGVIAYNETQRYPAIVTSSNGKINYNGNIADVKLNGPSTFCSSCIGQVINEQKILNVFQYIEGLWKAIVPQSDEKAHQLALRYPFRAGAAKSIIAVRSDILDSKNVLKFLRAHIVGALPIYDSGILHLIGPVKDLAVEGIPSEKIIGFNSRLIATIDGKDSKKRQKLQFENNLGVDFVLNHNGWIFNTQNFDKIRDQDQKKVVGQITNSIADSLFKTEIVADCTCVPLYGIHAQHLCRTKSSTFVPNKKVKGR